MKRCFVSWMKSERCRRTRRWLCSTKKKIATLLFRAINHGADDSITNPPNMTEVRLILRQAYRFHAAEREVQRLQGERATTDRPSA